MDPRFYRIRSQIILDRFVYLRATYNATAISRPFIFDRVEESDCIDVIVYLGSLYSNLSQIVTACEVYTVAALQHVERSSP